MARRHAVRGRCDGGGPLGLNGEGTFGFNGDGLCGGEGGRFETTGGFAVAGTGVNAGMGMGAGTAGAGASASAGAAGAGAGLAAADFAVMAALPPAWPARAVVKVTVDSVPAATPVTVTRPVSLIDTTPDGIAVPAQVNSAS